jgi:hypothetical protein
MMDLMLYPDEVHRMMGFLRDSKLHMLDFLEKNNLLSNNTGGTYVGSGGFGFPQRVSKHAVPPAEIA